MILPMYPSRQLCARYSEMCSVLFLIMQCKIYHQQTGMRKWRGRPEANISAMSHSCSSDGDSQQYCGAANIVTRCKLVGIISPTGVAQYWSVFPCECQVKAGLLRPIHT